jgi:ligand-binding SRPBCC domain-containing protein
MRYTYHAEQWLPYPLELVFAFFANPQNLPHLMPLWQNARIEDATFVPPPPRPGMSSCGNTIAAGVGTQVTISFKPFPRAPFRIPWHAEITDFIWNQRLCDIQLHGPFAYWRHCHTVTEETRTDQSGIPTTGTLLYDDVDYEMPLGKFGELAQRLFITRQLTSTFAFRHTRTADLLSRISARR